MIIFYYSKADFCVGHNNVITIQIGWLHWQNVINVNIVFCVGRISNVLSVDMVTIIFV